MRILDYQLREDDGLLDISLQCSKCGKTYIIKGKNLSKTFMGTCPHCGNIDIDRQASGEVPASTIKALIDIDQFVKDELQYSVEGKNIKQFLKDTYYQDQPGQIIPPHFHVTGIYRLKNIFATAKNKKKLDAGSFPDFETFMRWAVKTGYRDWKTLELDEQGLYSVASKWKSITSSHKASRDQPIAQLQCKVNTMLEDLAGLSENLNGQPTESYDTTLARELISELSTTLNKVKARLAN